MSTSSAFRSPVLPRMAARFGSRLATRLGTRLAMGVAALLAVAGVAGCGGSGSGSTGSAGASSAEAAVTAQPTPASATPSGTVLRIHLTSDSVDPAGTRVPVKAGQPVTLLITATAAGELHVHSTPEQHVDYPKGTSAATLTLDQPGIVEVESHALGKTIAQLEVR